uniref:Peptidase metallopeptidase domain-containing protein n=1 Tax=Plectus sambesii TaxID=2011161 RepID=A0A914WR98_9BILA
MALLLLLALSFSTALSAPTRPNSVTKDVALRYLTSFGYYNAIPHASQMDSRSSAALRAQQLELAVKKFQSFAGLPVTGVLDQPTKKLMTRKRCGIPDFNAIQREGFQFKWDKQDIRWTVEKFSDDVSQGDTRRAIGQALSVWQEVIPLNFIEVAPGSSEADIRVGFATAVHEDAYPFDGPGGVLAHAMFPPDGRLHFDDDENWVYMDVEKLKKYANTDLIAVAIHELGHSLGLEHSNDQDAIMAPFYHEQVSDKPHYEVPPLHEDDIRRIQRIYGSRNDGFRPETTVPRPVRTTTEAIETQTRIEVGVEGGSPSGGGNAPCPNQIEDSAKSINGATYVFADSNVWELQGQRLQNSRPITAVFPSGPRRVTAAVTNPRTELMILFDQRTVYAYVWDASSGTFHPHRDFPKTLSDLVTFTPTAAFEWRDGNIVLLGGDTFATYDENWNTPTFVHKTTDYFNGFPEDVTAVLSNGQPGHILLVTPAGGYGYDMNAQKVTNSDPIPRQQFAPCS